MSESAPAHTVRHYRHLLLWPLQLRVAAAGPRRDHPWELLAEIGKSTWSPASDVFTGNPAQFRQADYMEFVSFLPYVQRFLYGEMRGQRLPKARYGDNESPMHVMCRQDVAALRVVVQEGDAPLTLNVARVALHFFHDMDVVLLAVELEADDLPLPIAEELLYRFGRVYPSGWNESGQGMHNLFKADWLGVDGSLLASSDSTDKERFLRFMAQHRTPGIASHWAFLLHPLVQDADDAAGELRFRLLEYHRMPMMAYLAMDDVRSLQRDDFVHIGLLTSVRPGEALSRNDPAVADFESRYCDDRYWSNTEEGPNTRFMCTGGALIVVGNAHSPFFRDAAGGALAQFRHQYFLLFLIAHFHRAVLLLFSGLLVDAIAGLDVSNAESVRFFKRRIRVYRESFLRFTHRYWFHELSERGQVQSLFRRCAAHLGNDRLYDEVKEEITEMSDFLDSDSQRRQANSVVRLTVVTTFGMILTVATGFLGMNLIASADDPLTSRTRFFLIVTALTTVLTLFAIVRSKRLSDMLEALSDERLSLRKKLSFVADVFRKPKRQLFDD
jgi:CorA-like Mg2+ transporter protein